MDFTEFKFGVHDQFTDMAQHRLFVTNVTKDELWETYLKSFPEGSNPIFRERTDHDCQCCKSFIRSCGNVVSISPDFKLQSIWDVNLTQEPYQVVADAMSKLVKKRAIADIFLHYQKALGTDFNHQDMGEGSVPQKWEHFHFMLPKKFVNTRDLGTALSVAKSNQQVFYRGLEEITEEALETVLELIDQGSIYRGEEHRVAVASFSKLKKRWHLKLNTISKRDRFCWLNAHKPGARIRNTAIGTLLIDISEGESLNAAVKKFESKVAPQNYKRPTALITKSMIAKAQKKIEELGYTDSLLRRNATLNDLTINNVLFANRSTKKAMNVFDEMSNEIADNVKNLKKIEEIDINHFIAINLPQLKSIEILLENQHENNLMGLVAPVDPDAPGMFKWGNNFSWAYNGEVADSMKQRVKRAGGKIDGDLRFSIQWNDGDNNQNDFDAHAVEPNEHRICFRNKGKLHRSSGRLDVDIINPGKNVAVENIVYSNKERMPVGEYEFLVHNYNHCGGKTGFTAEIEFNGKIYQFAYNKNIPQDRIISVATVSIDKKGNFKIVKSLKSTMETKTIWGINSNKFHKVSMIMNSPNHWDGEQTGNKHYFFIIEGCQSGKSIRGFFNEFLKESMTEHRKVFEVLGSKMKTEPNNQLCGLGFSDTKRNSLVCKVTGSFERIIKIKF